MTLKALGLAPELDGTFLWPLDLVRTEVGGS